MTDQELIAAATELRQGVLAGRPSERMCAMVCWPLAGLLHACHGLDAECVETDLEDTNHIWIQLPDGRALDPTADQFNALLGLHLPPVYLGPRLAIHGAV